MNCDIIIVKFVLKSKKINSILFEQIIGFSIFINVNIHRNSEQRDRRACLTSIQNRIFINFVFLENIDIAVKMIEPIENSNYSQGKIPMKKIFHICINFTYVSVSLV